MTTPRLLFAIAVGGRALLGCSDAESPEVAGAGAGGSSATSSASTSTSTSAASTSSTSVSSGTGGWDYGPPALVELTEIGAPTWRPTGLQVFIAPAGTSEDDFALAGETIASVLSSHEPHPMGVWPSAEPHGPPYDDEVAEGVTGQGFVDGSVFSAGHFTAPSGIFVMLMIVPDEGAPTGSSADFSQGPILDPKMEPISFFRQWYRDGDPLFAPDDGKHYPGIDELTPPTVGDGYSHIEVIGGINDEHFDPIPGAYTHEIELLDVTDSGWLVVVHFNIQ